MLDTQLRVRVPARIEQDEDRLDVVLGGDRQKGVDALLETFRVLFPQLVMQEDAHGVHADAFGIAQFGVDFLRVEAARFPHLELVDGVLGGEVAADQPTLMAVPGIGLLGAPARGVGVCGGGKALEGSG